MNKTLVLGHRGFSGKYPENTMAAFEAVAKIPGCDGMESDVHLSADNEPVIIHDPMLDRTTSGSGPVGAHSFQELRKLDCGAWKGKQFAGQKMLHLDELLDFVMEHNLLLNLEVKNYEVFYKGIEEIVIRHILDKKAEKHVFLSSFNHPSMEICKDISPVIQTGFLYGYPLLEMVEYAKRYRAEGLHPCYTCLWYEPELVAKAHEAGYLINTWTANEEKDIQMCLDLGVDSIISNYPDQLAAMIQERRKRVNE